MSRRRPRFNPFYVLLVVLGIAFSISALMYGVMTWVALRGDEEAARSPFFVFMERHGGVLLTVELVLLALATFAAIGTDSYWQRENRGEDRDADEHPDHSSSSKRG
jgi:hypothetical protein